MHNTVYTRVYVLNCCHARTCQRPAEAVESNLDGNGIQVAYYSIPIFKGAIHSFFYGKGGPASHGVSALNIPVVILK